MRSILTRIFCAAQIGFGVCILAITLYVCLFHLSNVKMLIDNAGKAVDNLDYEFSSLISTLESVDRLLDRADPALKKCKELIDGVVPSIPTLSQTLKNWGDRSSEFGNASQKISDSCKSTADQLPIKIPDIKFKDFKFKSVSKVEPEIEEKVIGKLPADLGVHMSHFGTTILHHDIGFDYPSGIDFTDMHEVKIKYPKDIKPTVQDFKIKIPDQIGTKDILKKEKESLLSLQTAFSNASKTLNDTAKSLNDLSVLVGSNEVAETVKNILILLEAAIKDLGEFKQKKTVPNLIKKLKDQKETICSLSKSISVGGKAILPIALTLIFFSLGLIFNGIAVYSSLDE